MGGPAGGQSAGTGGEQAGDLPDHGPIYEEDQTPGQGQRGHFDSVGDTTERGVMSQLFTVGGQEDGVTRVTEVTGEDRDAEGESPGPGDVSASVFATPGPMSPEPPMIAQLCAWTAV